MLLKTYREELATQLLNEYESFIHNNKNKNRTEYEDEDKKEQQQIRTNTPLSGIDIVSTTVV